ncbi:MAG TPA: dihydroneopterin aldolase [Candidatus Omnitrophica bacterium]|nr:MAG: dihydroneopterin aldolase [Omnitrophica WOR_2 bacterium GWA2_63_20]OGX17119.1 MAG: dihydroneopterin aldolase [Omnitrophica WOR_2 bacterium GWF2_63_9]OGX32690.1 MAG: dihydroneopterin aldolase [Omnitrophica WOR_2 bacterium RIFCSPHIGHO2_12_FULL_64_13]OGX34758.1 MAG: dihydroneopterin aldolase [Omnitrophica WOR_2 bacterium RIFCSPHIGHO2_02_FULL_63_39]OGX44270.1 MAG: dihydroneopterin aldolase [Omnitrophica WOR_2 bacterium RIFCSPLOWO2_02_FULL_63_16]OGX47431.1 MAG: dihydroneopterin aldolase [Om
MSDKLIITGLAVPCRIGVTEAEREKPQTVWIDLELAIDAEQAATHDDVRQAVDYSAVVETVSRYATARPFNLLETLAEDIASGVLALSSTTHLVLRVTKRALPSIDSASVEIARSREASG